MKEGFYNLILGVPILVTVYVPFAVMFVLELYGMLCGGKKFKAGIRLRQTIATYAFSDIITKTPDKKWLLRDIELKDGSKLLTKVLYSLSVLFMALFSSVLIVFYQLLLLDISYHCDKDDKTKDCFEFKLVDKNRYSNDPIDCTSAVIQNGTVEVVCYKLVFNAGLAVGASYGTFKMSMVLINILTSAMLMVKVCIVRGILIFLYLGVMATVTAVMATSWRVFFESDTLLVNTNQLIFSLLIACVFILGVPWKELNELKNNQNRRRRRRRRSHKKKKPQATPETSGNENAGVDAVELNIT